MLHVLQNRPLQPKQHRLSTCGSQENGESNYELVGIVGLDLIKNIVEGLH